MGDNLVTFKGWVGIVLGELTYSAHNQGMKEEFLVCVVTIVFASSAF